MEERPPGGCAQARASGQAAAVSGDGCQRQALLWGRLSFSNETSRPSAAAALLPLFSSSDVLPKQQRRNQEKKRPICHRFCSGLTWRPREEKGEAQERPGSSQEGLAPPRPVPPPASLSRILAAVPHPFLSDRREEKGGDGRSPAAD